MINEYAIIQRNEASNKALEMMENQSDDEQGKNFKKLLKTFKYEK